MVEQVVATAPTVSHAELYAAGATFLLVAAQWLTAHRKGRKRDLALGPELDQRFGPVQKSLTKLSDDVRDLKAHVVGPDGQNGLRGDFRDIAKRVDGLEERERSRLTEDRLHGVPDRRIT